MDIDRDEFTRALGFTLLLGAARADGDQTVLEKLRGAVPTLKGYIAAGRFDRAEALVRSYMPVGWQPSAEWRLRDDC